MVKRKESRDFDVFLGVFLVFGRERKCREKLGRRENFRKMCLLRSGGPPTSILSNWVELDIFEKFLTS